MTAPTLFDHGGTTAEQPPASVVRALEGYGYRAEAVRRWTPEKAATVLNACRKEEAIALRRAARTAEEQDRPEGPARGQPSQVERAEAAAAIEQAAGCDELHMVVVHTVYCLRDDELRRLAGYLVRLFRDGKGERS